MQVVIVKMAKKMMMNCHVWWVKVKETVSVSVVPVWTLDSPWYWSALSECSCGNVFQTADVTQQACGYVETVFTINRWCFLLVVVRARSWAWHGCHWNEENSLADMATCCQVYRGVQFTHCLNGCWCPISITAPLITA